MKRAMTEQQAQTSQQRGINFVRDVLEDDERAEELEDETLDDWAERKGVQIVEQNPRRRRAPAEVSKNGRGCRNANPGLLSRFIGDEANLRREYKSLLKELYNNPCNSTVQHEIARVARDLRKTLAEFKRDLRKQAALPTATISEITDGYRAKKNPTDKEKPAMATKAQLETRVAELESELEQYEQLESRILDALGIEVEDDDLDDDSTFDSDDPDSDFDDEEDLEEE